MNALMQKGYIKQLSEYLGESMGELCFDSMAIAKAELANYAQLKSCFIEELEELAEWDADELPNSLSLGCINAALANKALIEAGYNKAYANMLPAILDCINEELANISPSMPSGGAAKAAAIARLCKGLAK